MSLNWIEINQILEELPLANTHIQKIRQPDFQTLVLDLYSPGNRFTLLISLAPGKTRLHRIGTAPKNEVALQRFAQFLRARIKGGRIVKARQFGRERIIEIQVIRGGEATSLWLRLWGGASNIVAADEEGTILDAFYRRPGRNEVSGGTFVLPPAGEITPGGKVFVSRFLSEETSVNQQVESFYSRLAEEEDLARLLLQVRRQLDTREGILRHSLALSREREDRFENPQGFKETGDLIMTNLHRIPKGEKWVTLENYYRDNQPVRVEMDPLLSPEENARSYYKKAAKARSGGVRADEEIQNIESRLKILEKERESLLAFPDRETLAAYLAALPAVHKVQKVRGKIPGLQFSSRGFSILVGRTAKENDELLRRYVKGNDTWLHARDYPGAYVFIRPLPGKSIPLDVLLDGANLALFYSKGRTSGRGELYYTQAKYLRRAKDGPTGLVLPTQEKNLSVVLEQDRLNRLQNPV